jgi:hypothetical protein
MKHLGAFSPQARVRARWAAGSAAMGFSGTFAVLILSAINSATWQPVDLGS